MTRDIATARTVVHLRQAVNGWRLRGERVGLVPTMGAIHAGHLSLIQAAHTQCDRVVASLFVNPTQFGPSEDFAAYPRGEAADLAAFASAGVDLVFMPAVAEMYPVNFTTRVQVGGVSEGLCGTFRPGHFDGMATVVTKLLLQCLPDVAYFGEKDYQQLTVIRRLARDLDIPVRIEGVPTWREPDGLAMSSRNAYLSPEERRIAPRLHQVLNECATTIIRDPDTVAAAVERGIASLSNDGFKVDYLELCDRASLTPIDRLTGAARLLVAAHLGRTRLIDNIPVAPG